MAEKSLEDWRAQLSETEFRVTREAGTERPHTGKYNQHNKPGVYHCLCCDLPLFSSQAKYQSHCGWPSFSDHMQNDNLSFHSDASHGMTRTEVRCAHCQAHLGHLFDDGPTPSHERYCINSVSLQFKEAK